VKLLADLTHPGSLVQSTKMSTRGASEVNDPRVTRVKSQCFLLATLALTQRIGVASYEREAKRETL
jgi:hypothetical protein